MTNPLLKALLIIAALGLSACANPDRFGGAGGAGGIDAGGLGSPDDPRSVAYFNQTIGDRVLFAVDQHTLTPEAQQILTQQAAWLNQNTQYSGIIEGHADEQGTREYNMSLSERRANSVREFLISQGVAGSRLVVNFYGKERPLALCSDESCYAQNRRAVTVLTAGAGV
jgi:peptidoglycan-associated lipoprotein